MLPTPHRMLVTFDSRIQSFVFDTLFQFIRDKLSVVPKLKVSSAYITLSLTSQRVELEQGNPNVSCGHRNALF